MQELSNLGKKLDSLSQPMKLSFPKIIERHTKPSEDFRRSPKTLLKTSEDPPKIPKITRTLPKISKDHLITSEDFRRSPEHFPMIKDIFKAFPSFGRSRAQSGFLQRQSL